MSGILITELEPHDAESYQSLLGADERTMIYPTLEFRSFLLAAVGGEAVTLAAWRDGEMVGALPVFIREDDRFGRVINSQPWYGSHGGCTLRDSADTGVRRALLQEYHRRYCRDNLLSGTMILTPEEEGAFEQYQALLQPLETDYRIGQINTLPGPGENLHDRLLASFEQKTRNLVRKSLKQEYEVVQTNDAWAWDILHAMHVENMQAMGGKAKPVVHMTAIQEHIPEKWRKILVALKDGQPVAALLLLYFNRTIEYIMPVIKVEHRSEQPLSFLIYHGMMAGIENGYRRWNWGGTWETQKTLHHFKAGWGCDDVRYSYCINGSEESRRVISRHLGALQDVFPFYYLFPFSKLDQTTC